MKDTTLDEQVKLLTAQNKRWTRRLLNGFSLGLGAVAVGGFIMGATFLSYVDTYAASIKNPELYQQPSYNAQLPILGLVTLGAAVFIGLGIYAITLGAMAHHRSDELDDRISELESQRSQYESGRR